MKEDNPHDEIVLDSAASGQWLYKVTWFSLQGLCLVNTAVCLSLVMASWRRLRRLRRQLTGCHVDHALAVGSGAALIPNDPDIGRLMRSFRISAMRLTTGSVDLFMCCLMGIHFLFLMPELQTDDVILAGSEVKCLVLSYRQLNNVQSFLSTAALLILVRLGMAFGGELVYWSSHSPAPGSYGILSTRDQLYMCVGVIAFTALMQSLPWAEQVESHVLCLRNLQGEGFFSTSICLVLVVLSLTMAISLAVVRQWAALVRQAMISMGESKSLESYRSTPTDDGFGLSFKSDSQTSVMTLRLYKSRSVCAVWIAVASVWIPWIIIVSAMLFLDCPPPSIHWTLLLLHMQTGITVFMSNLISYTWIGRKSNPGT